MDETPDSAVERVVDDAANDGAILDTTCPPCRASCDQNATRKCFAYDMPLPEETGAWIPVSTPPTGHAGYEVDFFPADSTLLGNNSYELSAWRILIEAIAFLCGVHEQKGRSKRCLRNKRHEQLAALPFRDYEDECFDPLDSSLSDQMEDHVRMMSAVLAAESPQWIPDSHAMVCMQCRTYFHPIFFSRHHCRFCGMIFCGSCTSQRTLLPVKFREKTPQRVCDSCYDRLAPVQGILFEQVSRAAQQATHDVTDLTCLRAWINSPLGFSLEEEIFKATNTLQSFMEITERINDVSFRLRLPDTWKIHNAFHVSLLKPFRGNVPDDREPDEQPEVEENEEILVPEQILAHKDMKTKGKARRRFLVKFKNYPALDAKWMEEEDLADTPQIVKLYLEAFGLA
ncbi:hypothetical protein L7F22_069388 [Adiantum nelumboides]|nr:hypothetical protein [Adiantum nelumboides]